MFIDATTPPASSHADAAEPPVAAARAEEERQVSVAFYIVALALIFALTAIIGILAGWSFGSILIFAYSGQFAFACVFIGISAARWAARIAYEPRAYIVGARGDINIDLDVGLSSRGFQPWVCATLSELDGVPMHNKTESSVALVDLDGAPCLVAAIDELILFRRRHPKMRVVLMSHEFSGDDLSAERKPICDASLRKPVSRARLDAALVNQHAILAPDQRAKSIAQHGIQPT